MCWFASFGPWVVVWGSAHCVSACCRHGVSRRCGGGGAAIETVSGGEFWFGRSAALVKMPGAWWGQEFVGGEWMGVYMFYHLTTLEHYYLLLIRAPQKNGLDT